MKNVISATLATWARSCRTGPLTFQLRWFPDRRAFTMNIYRRGVLGGSVSPALTVPPLSSHHLQTPVPVGFVCIVCRSVYRSQSFSYRSVLECSGQGACRSDCPPSQLISCLQFVGSRLAANRASRTDLQSV